jgi:hypothetical protein
MSAIIFEPPAEIISRAAKPAKGSQVLNAPSKKPASSSRMAISQTCGSNRQHASAAIAEVPKTGNLVRETPKMGTFLTRQLAQTTTHSPVFQGTP